MSTRYVTVTGTSPAAPGNAILGSLFETDSAYLDQIVIISTLRGATGGPLDVYIQTSFDGAAWVDVGHYTQIAAAAAVETRIVQTCDFVSSGATSIVTGDAILAAGVFLPGAVGKYMRVKMVAGAATSAGAVQTVNFALIRRDPA